MALIVCGFGIFALVDVKQLTELVDAVDKDSGFGIIRTGAVILVIVSAIIVLVTFFGCCGALKENRCMLGTYFTIILGLFIIMIVGAVLGVSKSLDELDKPLLSSIEKYDPNSESNDIKAIVKGWDNVQKDVSEASHTTIDSTHTINKPCSSSAAGSIATKTGPRTP